MSPSSPTVLGLIAGNGQFPLRLAEAARAQGESIIAIALKDEADPALESRVDATLWLSPGQLGKAIEFLKLHGATRAVMAGQVRHTRLFADILPDWRATKLLARVANQKAESVLSAVMEDFQSEGITFLSSVSYLEHWLCPAGTLSRRSPDARERDDIAFGQPLARDIARLDIGQTIVVKAKTVVAVEGMEGTDACIRRAGEIAGPGGVVIKMARPRQDLRFDVPVVGAKTLEAMKAAGATTLALEAGKTLLIEKPKWLEDANALGLAVQGVTF